MWMGAYMGCLVHLAVRALGTVCGPTLPVAAWNSLLTQHASAVQLGGVLTIAREVVHAVRLQEHTSVGAGREE